MLMKFWSFQKNVHYVHSLLFNRIHAPIESKDCIEIMVKTVFNDLLDIKSHQYCFGQLLRIHRNRGVRVLSVYEQPLKITCLDFFKQFLGLYLCF